MRANRSGRDPQRVEGFLYLRCVPSLDHVQVTLLDEREDDCVVCLLRRSAGGLGVDHYPDGWTLRWETDSEFSNDELESTIQLGPEATVESVRSTFEQRGWI